jgi:hypothetical protein
MARLTTPTSDFMPSNGIRLSASDIGHVRTWIQNGCADQNGALPVAPDLPPYFVTTSGFAQYSALKNILPIPSGQLDTGRVGGLFYNSFIVPQGQQFYIAFVAADDSTSPAQFTVKQIKLSLDKDNFSSATTASTAIFYNPYWVITIPNTYPSGTTVYFRFYVNDGHHVSPTEYPTNQSFLVLKTYCSFYIQ